MAVGASRRSASARRRAKREVGGPQFVDVDMVQKRGEPLFLLQPRGLPYAVEAVGRAFPARCPERAALIRVLLGPALGSTGSIVAVKPMNEAGRPADTENQLSTGDPLPQQGGSRSLRTPDSE